MLMMFDFPFTGIIVDQDKKDIVWRGLDMPGVPSANTAAAPSREQLQV